MSIMFNRMCINEEMLPKCIYIYIYIYIYINKTCGTCWRSKEELISDVLLWTPSHRHASVGQPGRTYLH